MQKTVRSAVGALLQTSQKLNTPYTFVDNSIMNRQLGILPDNIPSETPWTQYVTIGIGGMGVRFYENNTRVEMWPQPHEPQHTGLYNQIPFVIRALDEDLEVNERSRFRLRVVKTIDGVPYACYYGRLLDLRATLARLEYRQIIDGQVVSNPWEPSVDDQHPKPKQVNPGQVLETGDDYIAATAKTPFAFSIWDITELVNVSNVLFKTPTAVNITELGLCSGIDFEHRASFNGIMLPYTEAVGVQITDFVSTFLPVYYNRAGASINLDVGSVEPLLALKTATP